MTYVEHDRQSIRLQDYDYGKCGAYHITICAYQHKCLFGEIKNGEIIKNKIGNIVESEWLKTPPIRPEIKLDEYIVMPDHIHGIVWIDWSIVDLSNVGARSRVPLRQNYHQHNKWQHIQPKSISSFVLGFKSTVTKQINVIRNTPNFPLWQRNYFEHVVRNNHDLARIRKYIIENPLKWKK